MAALQAKPLPPARLVWLDVALALLTALASVLIARQALGVGDLQPAEAGGASVSVAAGGYLIGLLYLIVADWRRARRPTA